MNKNVVLEVFELELSIINRYSVPIRMFTVDALSKITDDGYWINSASKTGVHHPKTSNIYGGNIIHTKQAFYIALTLIYSDPIFKDNNSIVACILSSILLHDSLKFSNTLDEHGSCAANEILKYAWCINMKHVRLISDCVRYHMGKFGVETYDPNKYTEIEQRSFNIVHGADYVSSRPYIEFNEEIARRGYAI